MTQKHTAQYLEQALQEHFGFEYFQPGQKKVIEHLMAGKSALALFPTGGGKSLCYQLPALLLPGLTLVVSPLIALMKDQIDALSQRGISSARLDSSLSAEAYKAVLHQARSGLLKMLYVAPERFNNERFRAVIAQIPIALLAIDEAHCLSEWGHNFRPDYLKLPEFAQRCGAERVLTLTATATLQVQKDICHAFNIEEDCAVRTGFYRPNLTVLTTPVLVEERDILLQEKLHSRPLAPTIIYVTLQKTAEIIAQQLNDAGFSARAYHAGMKNEQRSEMQEWFMNGDEGIIVATIAFGMGVDKANIRYVYHYNLPKSLENFAQEIGRAGRDGQASICEVLLCLDDLNILENFIYGDTPTETSLHSLVDDIFSHDEIFDVSQYELSNSHDIRLLVLRTLLTYLELDGYLEGGTPFYANYRFKPLYSSHEILAHFEGERREFIANLFRQSSKAKIWFTIDIAQATQTLNTSRERIVRALDYLGEKNLLEVSVSGVRNRYRIIQRPQPIDKLVDNLYQRALQRESSDIDRLQQVIDLSQQNSCQVNVLSAYFNDEREHPCGHCSYCLRDNTSEEKRSEVRKSMVRNIPVIDDKLWKQALALQAVTPLLADSTALARFLCGITSPYLTRAKFSRHALFGALSHVPFKQLLKLL